MRLGFGRGGRGREEHTRRTRVVAVGQKVAGAHAGLAAVERDRGNLAVEIDPDFELNYQYVMSAISACTGMVDKQGRILRYVEKIKFAPPRPRRSER